MSVRTSLIDEKFNPEDNSILYINCVEQESYEFGKRQRLLIHCNDNNGNKILVIKDLTGQAFYDIKYKKKYMKKPESCTEEVEEIYAEYAKNLDKQNKIRMECMDKFISNESNKRGRIDKNGESIKAIHACILNVDILHREFKGLNDTKTWYKRLYFSTFKARTSSLYRFHNERKELKQNNNYYDTGYDSSSFLRVYARINNLPLSGHAKFNKLTRAISPPDSVYDFVYQGDKIVKATKEEAATTLHKSLVFSCDIETYSEEFGVPKIDDHDSLIYMISVTGNWTSDKMEKGGKLTQAMDSIVLTLRKTNQPEKRNHKYFDTEQELLMGFAQVIEDYAPEYLLTFNGYKYDIPFILTKCEKYGIEQEFGKKFYYIKKWDTFNYDVRNDRKIKMSAENSMAVSTLKTRSLIHIDVRMMIKRKLNDKEMLKGSLNKYLTDYKLPLKIDLPYETQERGYLEDDVDIMTETAEYCIIDSLSCYRLLVAAALLVDKLGFAELTNTGMKAGIENADTAKISNYINMFANKEGMVMTEWRRQSGNHDTFKGGHVVDPHVGLRHWVFSIDFSSLYPSVMKAYNICPTNIIKDPKIAALYMAKGYNMRKFVVPVSDKDVTIWIKQQKNEHYYEKTIVDGKKVVIEHNKDLDDYGLIPRIQILLKKGRNITKKIMKKEKDNLKKSMANGLQLAQKKVMNTIYGMFGDPNSPFFDIVIPALTTQMGRKSLAMAEQISHDNGFILEYGDTDSIFISPENFTNIDPATKKALSVTDSMKKLIKIAEVLTKKVNDAIVKDTGRNCLILEFENAFPSIIFITKKRYIGWTAPEGIEVCMDLPEDILKGHPKLDKNKNLINGKMYKKGILKSSQTMFDKTSAIEAALQLCHPLYNWTDDNGKFKYSNNNILEFYGKFVRNLYNTFAEMPMKMLSKKMMYKDDVNNITVHTFKRRMEARKKNPPPWFDVKDLPEIENYEYMNLVQIDIKYRNVRGTVVIPNVGESLEYLHVAIKYKLKPNRMKYLKGLSGIVGFIGATKEIYDKVGCYDTKKIKKYAQNHLNVLIDPRNTVIQKELRSMYGELNYDVKNKFITRYNFQVHNFITTNNNTLARGIVNRIKSVRYRPSPRKLDITNINKKELQDMVDKCEEYKSNCLRYIEKRATIFADNHEDLAEYMEHLHCYDKEFVLNYNLILEKHKQKGQNMIYRKEYKNLDNDMEELKTLHIHLRAKYLQYIYIDEASLQYKQVKRDRYKVLIKKQFSNREIYNMIRD